MARGLAAAVAANARSLDNRTHRWLLANGEGWRVFAATRRELQHKIAGDAEVAVARLELPVISGEVS